LIIGGIEFIIDQKSIAGAAVLFGPMGPEDSPFDLSQIDGINGFVMHMDLVDGGNLVTEVNGLGDVNGDGTNDLILGAPAADFNDHNAGAAFVVFGRSSGFPPTIKLSSLDGNNGFIIQGEDPLDFLGLQVKIIPDMNGDEVDEVLIQAPGAENTAAPTDQGAIYVVFGQSAGFPATMPVSGLNGSNGFVMLGEYDMDELGETMGAGDFNHDGLTDLIFSTENYDNFTQRWARSYAVSYTHLTLPTQCSVQF